MNYDKKPLLEKEEQDKFKVISVLVKLTPKQIQKLEKVRTIIEDAPQNKLEDIAELISPKNKDMRTTARDFLMDGNEGYPFRDVIDNLDEDIILDCMEEYADYKVANSAKKVKEQSSSTENLFTNLKDVKHQIAQTFSKKYFNDDYYHYWLGEVLSINDKFIDLENIQFALENNIYENVLYKYLNKPRNYNLEDYCLGKVGRKNKNKQELKKCKENVNYAWGQLQEAITQETNKADIFKERNIYNNLEDKE